MIGVRFSDHFGNANDGGWVCVGVIDQNEVALFHVIAHEIPSLIISDTVPASRLFRFVCEILNGIGLGLRFDEPVSLWRCHKCLSNL